MATAGSFAGSLFGIGLLASALLALPVLMTTTANLLCAHRQEPHRLSHGPRRAPAFYASLCGALLLGIGVAFTGMSAIRLLLFASIAGGVATPVGIVFLLLVGRDRSAMRGRRVSRRLAAAGYAVVAIVLASCAAALVVG